MSLIYVGSSKCTDGGGESKIRFESFCPHLAAVTINAITPLLFKCVLCCLFPYQHIDSTGNAEYTLVGIHICIHPGCFDSHAGTCGFHHIHPHLCNWGRSRIRKNTGLYTLPNTLLTLIIIIATALFRTEEYCCNMEAPFWLVSWKAWKSVNVVVLSINNLTGAFKPLQYLGRKTTPGIPTWCHFDVMFRIWMFFHFSFQINYVEFSVSWNALKYFQYEQCIPNFNVSVYLCN